MAIANKVLIFIIFNIFYKNGNAACPDFSENSKTICSSKIPCEEPALCYRDAEETEWKCCGTEKTSNFCSGTGAMPGADYDPVHFSYNAFSAQNNSEYFYEEKIGMSNKTSMCPKPFSAFLFGKLYGPFLSEEFHLPAGWKHEYGSATGFTKCCVADDCPDDQYCGKVRNPTTHELMRERVEKKKKSACEKSKHRKNAVADGLLKFCYKHPPNETYSGTFQPSEREKLENYDELQLCSSHWDCEKSTDFCLSKGDLGYCVSLAEYIISPHVRDYFLIKDTGCTTDSQCEQHGSSALSWRCQSHNHDPKRVIPASTYSIPNICVGFEKLCSPTASSPHGTQFGCKNKEDCSECPEKHVPVCVTDPFGHTNACCFEMASCDLPMDVQSHGMMTLEGRMCSEDVECQEVADRRAHGEGPASKSVYWGRCVIEMEGENLGKCCIARLVSLCHVGRSFVPPKVCRNDTDCGGESMAEWCDETSGFCCRDHPGERSWLCPDERTLRRLQPKCEGHEDDCQFGAGMCLAGRCCPKISREGSRSYVWSEVPWYLSDVQCNDTPDLPHGIEWAYCDPRRKCVARISRTDRWLRPTVSTGVYCTSNSNCSEAEVCVRETDGIWRCHVYYDRDLNFSFVGWLILAVLVNFACCFVHFRATCWRRGREDLLG